jgi:GNAT superfamily N-acetyltransferase
MVSELVIRNLGRGDLDSLLSLYGQLHPQDDPLPARDEVEQIWHAIVMDAAQIYLGGFVDGVLVSACNAAVIPNLTRGARPYAVVENVVTDAGYRRQGIGSQVLRQLLEQCWARRCYKVMLMSRIERAQSHAFYEALGFDKKSKQAFVITAP